MKYLNEIFAKVKGKFFNDEQNDTQRVLQRLIIDGDVYTIYYIEKWLENFVAKSSKPTYLHRLSASTKLNKYPYPGAGHADDTYLIFAYAKKHI